MTYRSQRVAYAYFLAAVLLFGLQIAFGFLSLAKYLGPDPLLNVMHFATTKAIHTNLLLVWVITGFMGAAYYMVPEESRAEIYSVRLAYVQLGLWLAIGVAAIGGYLFHITAGRKFLEMPQPLKYGVVVVMLMFLANLLLTIKRAGRWTTTEGILLGGLASAALLFIPGMIHFDRRRRAAAPAPESIAYPEWDYRLGAYRQGHCRLREAAAPAGEPQWSPLMLRQYRTLIHRIRRQFEALRPRRQRDTRQLDGDALDLDAYVDDFALRQAGGTPSARLHLADRPRRRDVSAAFLIDASGSTDAQVCGLQSASFTRLGAPIRHVTALLARQATRRRLLLLLSDGKPNDDDEYEGVYGVEDTRQAAVEARLQGVDLFCLTVDRQGAFYLPRMFGQHGYASLWNVHHLPCRLSEMYRRLTALRC
jgi:hypothetical protein